MSSLIANLSPLIESGEGKDKVQSLWRPLSSDAVSFNIIGHNFLDLDL